MACSCLSTVGLIILGLLVLLKVYLKLTSRSCTSKVSLVGKTTIVTGANTGIGYETALEFAKRGARVILACRDEIRGTDARDKIVRATENKNVIFQPLDLASLNSVRKFAKNILETEERLDILVNNAGILSMEGKLSEDGLDLLMQVNYFGPFLLTVLLIERLKKSAPSRIINVSSIAARYAKLDVNKIKEYAGNLYAYCNSKLGNVLFTIHLAKLLKGHNVTVYSLHPGTIRTNIFGKHTGLKKYLVDFVGQYYFKTPEEGAQTTLFTALEQGIEIYSGRYFDECQVIEHYSTAKNPNLSRNLWDKTVEILKCQDDVKNL